MVVEAIKKNNGKVVFDLPDKTEPEAIEYAKNSIRKTLWDNLKKRPYGWTYKIK